MEKSARNEKLKTYSFEDKILRVGFANFRDAEEYAMEKGGKLVEIGFKDGNDNPQITDEAGLLEKKLHFFVDAGREYKFIHSADAGFRDYADQLQKISSNEKKESLEERFISNAQFEIAEDPIVVLKNNKFESVTSRERSKYLKHAKVYEIGVIKILGM